jgi:putative nucleic acid binding protein
MKIIPIASHSHPASGAGRRIRLSGPLCGLCASVVSVFLSHSTTETLGTTKFAQRGVPRVSWRNKRILISLSLMLLTACQAASSGQPGPVPAGALTKEYQESTTDARRKYDGREITVKGLTVIPPMMPPSGSEEGLILLEERGASPPRRVSCWFSRDQAEQFAKVKGGQYITVKGIFNGEAGAELKFCKLVEVE